MTDASMDRPLVLIVDDEESMRKVLEKRVGSWGYRVHSVQDGEEALRAAVQARPAVVLLDVMMPGLDGLETCRRLKAAAGTRAIPVILVTANDSKQFPEDAKTCGAEAWLHKPYDASALRALLARLLPDAGPQGKAA